MTTESGGPNPESGADREPIPSVRFGPAFACCSTARTLLVFCALILFGTGSFLALQAGLLEHLPSPHHRTRDWIEIVCVAGYVLALFLSLVGTLSIFIHGLSRSGEVVIHGARYRGTTISKIALSIFTLPWILLGMRILWARIR